MKTFASRRVLSILLCLCMLAAAFSGTASAVPSTSDSGSFAGRIESMLMNPDMTHKVAARWWLAEGSHTDETLIESIEELYRYGFGAVEFVALDESAYLDESRYSWGTQEWIEDSQLIVEECTKRGMGVSFTSGTHWSNANLPTIRPDEESASQELGYKTIELASGETFSGALPQVILPGDATAMTLTGVVAAQVSGRTEENRTLLREDSLTDITAMAVQEDGVWTLDYTAPQGDDSILFVFWQYGTSQIATPSVETNYVINYFSEEGANALIRYWDETVLTPQLKQAIQQNGEVSMYMDSLELEAKGADTTGNLWCADYLSQFKARRGYDVTKYLPLLILDRTGKNPSNPLTITTKYWYELDEGNDSADKIRNDLYQTNTELYSENCLQVLTEWLHSFGMTLRAENSYGLLLEISQPIANIDYVEGESLEFAAEIDRFRSQSGAAHLYNKVYSSESGALMGSNYWHNSAYYRQIFYTQFAAGVQKTVTHGYSAAYGPEGNVKWPGFEGMWDMFSCRFNQREPASIDYQEYWGQLNRIQTVLRQGVPQMDLGILRTDYNFDVMAGTGRELGANTAFHQGKGYYWMDQTLQQAGYTYDYFSPYLLQDEAITCESGLVQADGAAYQALLVYQEEMPLASAERLLQWARDGLPVVLVTGPTEELTRTDYLRRHEGAAITTGSLDGRDDELALVMAELKAQKSVACVDTEAEAYDALIGLSVHPRAEFAEPNQNLLTVMRKDGDTSYLYVYNYMFEQKESYAGKISVDGLLKPYLINTYDGTVKELAEYSCENGRTLLNIDLAPGEVAVFALDGSEQPEKTVVSKQNVDQVMVENGKTVLYVPQSGTASVTYSDGTTQSCEVTVPDAIELDGWNLTVESWTAGDKLVRTEDKGRGYVTTEVTYDTQKTSLYAGETELLPWKEIDAVGDTVSGVGTYTAVFTLPESWDVKTNALLFQADSFNGGTAQILINGQEVPVNFDTCTADLSAAVVPGENLIEVRVTSSLRNVLMANGYASVGMWAYIHRNELAPADYGMTGAVSLTAYTKVGASASDVLSVSAPETAQAGSDFAVTVVTNASVTDVKLFNEYSLAIGTKSAEVTSHADGTKTWNLTVSVGTPGSRTFKVVTRGSEGYYLDSKTSVSLEITSIPPVLNRFDLPESTVANRTFIVKATTDLAATKIAVYNEYGTKMGLKSLSYKIVDGQKEWIGVMSIGTKGERTFTATAVNKYGVQSDGLTGSISVQAYA